MAYPPSSDDGQGPEDEGWWGLPRAAVVAAGLVLALLSLAHHLGAPGVWKQVMAAVHDPATGAWTGPWNWLWWPVIRAAGHACFVLPVVYSSAPVYALCLVLLGLAKTVGWHWQAIFMLVAMMSPLIDMICLREIPRLRKGQSLSQDAWRRIRKDRFAMTCLTIICFYASVALLCRIELLASGENEPVRVARHAWVKGEWQPYVFTGGENLPEELKKQAPQLEYQPPSIFTNLQIMVQKLWLTTSGTYRQQFRQSLGLGPIPTNDDLEAQIAAYQAAVAEQRTPPPITLPKGDYDRPGPDGLYPDERNRIPGWFDYPMGTDFLCRDVFKRVLHGTRIAMSVGLVSCIIAIPIGAFFGALAGFYGGLVDEMIVLVYSTVASIPGLLLLLAFVMVVGKGIIGVYIALGMTSWVSLCRLVRGEFIKHKEREYVVAARSLGATDFSCIFKHILPNVFHILIINFSLRFVYAVQSEVILSYLGVGVNDQPSWGVMINDAKLELARGVWWQLAAATGAMFMIVLALNIFGDILRDALDPKLRN